MKSRYSDSVAPSDLLALRCYTSRLLGAEPSLVLHGGGNTSVKGRTKDFFGREVDVLWVKGSGWDLSDIEPAGFPAVRMETLLQMAQLETLSDADMVREQRAAMLDPSSPNPSVEAILHALLPHTFVDHTHADAIVALTNNPSGEARIQELFGARVLIIPYVMPGFVLAREVAKRIEGVDFAGVEGMVLMNHGLFTFGDTAKESYERTIQLVDQAETALVRAGAPPQVVRAPMKASVDTRALATLRREVSVAAGHAMIARLDTEEEAHGFASRADVSDLATRGPVTPDHVIRTKRVPIVFDAPGADANDAASSQSSGARVEAYAADYRAYFEAHHTEIGAKKPLTMLDPAPRWGIWKGVGMLAFGASAKNAEQTADIARHSMRCFQWGEALGGWTPLPARALFEMEYWELEQAKLGKGAPAPLAGKVALVTGAASGIGRAVAKRLRKQGAAVCVLDRKDDLETIFRGVDVLPICCDVTDSQAVDAAIARCVRAYGGLDLLVSNAGDFPPSARIAELSDEAWERSLSLNVGSHFKVLRAAVPFLERGIDPAVVIVASRNVPAPGPGAAAYSVAKAGLTQLARVATLELAPAGVRVGVLHPDKVFDTELWSDDKIALRAKSYGVSVEQYKKQNLLGREVSTEDVADAAMSLIAMRSTTGAQLPVDGGSDRVV